MKNKIGLIWFLLGGIPYALTCCFAIVSMFIGVNSCILDVGYGLCEVVYGLRGFGQVWYMVLYILFPLYLVFLFFIILGFSKKRITTVTLNRMLLLFGASPFALSLFLFLCACLARPGSNLASLFSSIFINHFFIVISDCFGLLFILKAIFGIQKETKVKKKRRLRTELINFYTK